MKRPRSRPHIPAGGGPHFDIGARPLTEAPPEMVASYMGPEQEDAELRAQVIAWLARLRDTPRGGEKG